VYQSAGTLLIDKGPTGPRISPSSMHLHLQILAYLFHDKVLSLKNIPPGAGPQTLSSWWRERL